MSDVSGIPNMGFGGGNFFAPQFSYNPQMSAGQASAAYMPAENYAQNVTNNIFSSGGGFGKQTDYYSQLAANQLSALTPYTFDQSNAGTGMTVPQMQQAFQGGGPGGGTSLNTQAWDQSSAGPDWGSGIGFSTGGGGLFSGSASSLGGGGGGYSGPTIDWSGVGNAAAGMSAPSGAQPFDWSNIFGGAKADPAPGMAMPGGLNAPMSGGLANRPDIQYGGPGAATGSAPYTSGIEPDQSAQTFAGGAAPTDPFPGMSMPGGLNSPMTTPEPGASFGERFDALGGNAPGAPRTYDFAPMFEGGGGGFGTGGTESQTFGGNAGSFGGNPFSYIQDPSATKEAPGPSAEDMAGQARDKLAALMGGTTPEQAAETAKAVEATKEAASSEPSMRDFVSPEQGYGNFQQAATPRTGYAADLDFLSQRGGHNSVVKNGLIMDASLDTAGNYKPLSPELAARLATAARDYEATTGKRANFGEFSRGSDVQQIYWDRYQSGTGGIAASPGNSRHQAGNAGDIGRGDFRNWLQANGDVYGVNFPVRGDPVHVQMDPAYQGPSYVQPDNVPRPPADIPYPQGIPMPAERPDEAPARPVAALPEQGQGVNEGQVISRPPADIPDPRVSGGGFNAIDAAAKHSGLELARANIDTPIEKIAMERGGQKAVDQVSSMAVGMTPRQLLQSYGGLFMSRAEPLFQSLGITRQDFDKAIAMPSTQQDIKMRFGEGGDFGPYPAYTGPETALGGGFPDFRQSTNIEDRRGMPDAPFGVPGSMPSTQDLLGYTPQQWPAEAYPASFDERFGGAAAAPEPATSMRDFVSPEQGYGSFQGAASLENRLEAQRAGYAASVRDSPEKSLQLAARLYSEDQNNPATRQAILETMLNAQQASGRDPLNPKYFPGNTQQYRDALAKLSSNNDLLNQIYAEMETPFSGSNRANFATDWSSGPTASRERKYATPTWTSPANEQFFRKDISNEQTGLARAAQNQKWYQSTRG